MKPTLLSVIILTMALFFNSLCTYAATYYWVGSTSHNWNTLANWKLSSCGGTTPSSLPGSADSVVFSGSCSDTSCTINAAINVLSFRVDGAYTGTITQSSGNTVTIAIGRFTGGTYTGSSDAIAFSTSLKIDGGTFTASSGSTTLKGNFTFTSGTFNHNNGRFIFYTTLTFSGTSTLTLYDAEFRATVVNTTVTLSNNITVNDSTLLTGSDQLFINSSTSSVINASGDVKIYNTSGAGGGTATIVINGSSTQHLIGNPTTEDVGKLPNLTINKSSGTLYLAGYITMGGSTTLTYTAGTINAGTSDVVFYYDNTITGSMTFNNVEFQGTSSTCVVSNTVTVNGNIYTTLTASVLINTGTLNLYGNLAVSNTSYNIGSTATVNFTGTANDSIIVSSGVASGEGFLPNVTINKTGGTLYFKGNISLTNNWTNNYSTASINPGTSLFTYYYYTYFDGTIGGTYPTPFWNVQFMCGYEGTLTLSADSEMIVKNNLTLGGNALFYIDGHSINVYGNIIASNTSAGDYIGTTVLNLVGSANDSIISPSTATCELPTITINKTGGTLYLSGTIYLCGSWTNNYSTSNVNAGTSTLRFIANGTIGGTYHTSAWNVIFGGYGETITVGTDSELIVKNNLTINGNTLFYINSHVIPVYGNITNSSTLYGDFGSTTFNLVGSANDSIISPPGYTLQESYLPNIYINKTGGTLNLIGNISVVGNWIYANGIVNAGTSTVGKYGSGTTLTGTGSSSSMTFNNVVIGSGATATLGSALNVGGNLTINSSTTLNTSSSNYQIKLAGNWVNNGTYTGNNSDVTFNGSLTDSIMGSSTTSFYSLTANKTGTLTLTKPIAVTHALTLTSGDILTSSTNLLTLNNGATTSGASDASFVNGPIKKIGNAAFTFPTGAGSSYHPISINAPSSTSDAFTAQYFNSAPSNPSTTDDSLTYVSACDYWTLTHPAGSSNVTVTLGWGTSSCDIIRLSTLRVGYWNGSEWVNLGQSANTGSTSTGTVTATITSSISTSAVDFAISKHSPTPTASAGSAVTICYGSSTTLGASASGGFSPYTYTWSPATGLSATTGASTTASPTATTTYTVTAQDNDNAPTATGTVVVTVNPLPTLTVSASHSTICYGNSSTLTTSGASTYTWTPTTGLNATTGSSVTTTTTYTTTYTVTGTNSYGCVNTATETITVNSLPTVTASASPSYICYNSTSALTSGGAVTYVWSPLTGLSSAFGSSDSTTLTSNTTYTVTGTDTNGCMNTANVSVTVNPQLIVNSGAYRRLCYGSNDTLGSSPTSSGGTSPYTYSWASSPSGYSSTLSNPVVSPTVVTTYTLTVTDNVGCTATDSTLVAGGPQLYANAGYFSRGICVNTIDTLGGNPVASGWIFHSN